MRSSTAARVLMRQMTARCPEAGAVKDTGTDRAVSKRLVCYLLRPAMAESRIIRYGRGVTFPQSLIQFL